MGRPPLIEVEQVVTEAALGGAIEATEPVDPVEERFVGKTFDEFHGDPPK